MVRPQLFRPVPAHGSQAKPPKTCKPGLLDLSSAALIEHSHPLFGRHQLRPWREVIQPVISFSSGRKRLPSFTECTGAPACARASLDCSAGSLVVCRDRLQLLHASFVRHAIYIVDLFEDICLTTASVGYAWAKMHQVRVTGEIGYDPRSARPGRDAYHRLVLVPVVCWR